MSTVLITGASSGIGHDLAMVFAEHGHDLIITSRGLEPLQRLAAVCTRQFSVNVRVIAKDLADAAAPQQICDELAASSTAVDCLVNNAGFGSHGPFAQSNLDTELSILNVNVRALMQLTHLLLPQMIQRRHGRILNVASTAAYVPGPYMSTYYASKAFVLSHSVALNRELRRYGVTVTALCPGPTNTNFQQRAGMTASKLFRFGAMSPLTVARFGYRAMMRGKMIAIPGLHNRLGAALSRLCPYWLSSIVTARLNGQPKVAVEKSDS